MIELPSQPIADVDPEFEKMALETGEFTWSLPGISVREKALLCLANDVCRSHVGLALRLHVQAALSHGVPFADLLALVRFIAPYAGYPASADVLARLGAIADELGVDVRAEASGVAHWEAVHQGGDVTDPGSPISSPHGRPGRGPRHGSASWNVPMSPWSPTSRSDPWAALAGAMSSTRCRLARRPTRSGMSSDSQPSSVSPRRRPPSASSTSP